LLLLGCVAMLLGPENSAKSKKLCPLISKESRCFVPSSLAFGT
jgi:hypothetical protein